MPTAGQIILDADGKKQLLADGTTELGIGEDCDCDCSLKCFQIWGAYWDCETSSWVLTPGAKVCLPAAPTSGWTGSGCSGYILYYAMDEDCTTDGDCTDFEDTATPDPPFVGKPPDCCCCESCPLDPDPECCSPCPTPSQVRVTIVAASGSVTCSFDTAPNFHVHKIDVSLLVGTTFTIPYGGGVCVWSKAFDVTSLIRMLQCNGDGTGCAACTPTTDVTGETIMTISVGAGGVGFTINLVGTDPELDNSPDGFTVVAAPAFSSDYEDCCNPWSAVADGPLGTEPFEQIFITAVVVVPC